MMRRVVGSIILALCFFVSNICYANSSRVSILDMFVEKQTGGKILAKSLYDHPDAILATYFVCKGGRVLMIKARAIDDERYRITEQSTLPSHTRCDRRR